MTMPFLPVDGLLMDFRCVVDVGGLLAGAAFCAAACGLTNTRLSHNPLSFQTL